MKTNLTKVEFHQVSDSMRNAMSAPPLKKAKKPQAEKQVVVETPEEKAMRAASANRQLQLKKLKASYEKVRKETGDVSKLLPGVVAKGYPEAFVKHLEAQLASVAEHATLAASLYAEEIIAEHKTLDEVEKCTAKAVIKVNSLDAVLTESRRNLFPDIKRLSVRQ